MRKVNAKRLDCVRFIAALSRLINTKMGSNCFESPPQPGLLPRGGEGVRRTDEGELMSLCKRTNIRTVSRCTRRPQTPKIYYCHYLSTVYNIQILGGSRLWASRRNRSLAYLILFAAGSCPRGGRCAHLVVRNGRPPLEFNLQVVFVLVYPCPSRPAHASAIRCSVFSVRG